MFTPFIQGLALQAGLILALGAQNIFVLNSGLRRRRHLLVASVCSLCDAFLILTGVLGVAGLFVQFPLLKIGLGCAGAGFLFYYGLLKLRESKKDVELSTFAAPALTTRQAVLASLGFSLLNPHVYLDTVVLIGGFSTRFDRLDQRLLFGAGASSFSVVWFFNLALLASFCGRFLANPKITRGVSLASGLILVVLSIKLGGDVVHWATRLKDG